LALSAALYGAQEPSAAKFSPPPVWRPDAASSLPRQYVFATATGDALIIRVPAESDYVKHGGLPLIRYDLHNKVIPEIATRVARRGDRFDYSYTISNAKQAGDPIRMWWLIIPAGTEQIQVSPPDQWGGAPTVPAIMRQVELPDQPLGRSIMWLQDDPQKVVLPGRSKADFNITSSCKPGFTSAFFGSGTLVNFDQNLPPEVFEQLRFYDDPTWGKASRLSLGPTFCGDVSVESAAANLISGIRRLIQLNRLQSSSSFVADALAALRSGKRSIDHPPTGPGEVEVLTALQLTLGFTMGRTP
jgi:hypothetical protein